MSRAHTRDIERRPDGWWIVSPDPQDPDAGPYSTKAEALDDRRGISQVDRWYRKTFPAVATLAEERRAVDLFGEPLPEPVTPPAPIDADKHRQKPLISGLDCLPGQQDLFRVDGDPEQ